MRPVPRTIALHRCGRIALRRAQPPCVARWSIAPMRIVAGEPRRGKLRSSPAAPTAFVRIDNDHGPSRPRQRRRHSRHRPRHLAPRRRRGRRGGPLRARGGLPSHRYRRDVRQRGGGRRRPQGQRRAARRGVRHHQGMARGSRPRRSRALGGGKPQAAASRRRRPPADPLAQRRNPLARQHRGAVPGCGAPGSPGISASPISPSRSSTRRWRWRASRSSPTNASTIPI